MGDHQDHMQRRLKRWDDLAEQQATLFKQTIERNAELEARNEEVERELGVWKAAVRDADKARKELASSLARTMANHERIMDDNPLVLCLIDGDGNIFRPELIAQGNIGGGQAAKLLTEGIFRYLESSEATLAGRAQIWLTVYCNLSGLRDTLIKNDLCTFEQFDAFVVGFNQSSALFAIIDVGGVKEAADSKLKESLRIFTRLPQIRRVFFGGGHDNGYVTTLNYLQTEDFLRKIVLLKGYNEIAQNMRNLDMPEIEIPGVFIAQKLPPKRPTVPVHMKDRDRRPYSSTSNGSPTPPPTTTLSPPTPPPPNYVPKGRKQVDPSQPLIKQQLKPPPCNLFYLLECRKNNKCPYGHHYTLTETQVEELRTSARKSPCTEINRGALCMWGDDRCILGHYCPRGSKCYFKKQGKCKFVGVNMHQPPIAQHSSHLSFDSASDSGSIHSLLIPLA